MLNKRILKADTLLSSLTEEQFRAIEKLSENDENATIAQKLGEVHKLYDETVFKVTGIERNGDEKSYNYLARAGAELKKKAESFPELERKIEDLEKDKKNLEKSIKEGAQDKELALKLQNASAELKQTKKQFLDLQTRLSSVEKEHNKKIHEIKVDNEIKSATSGLKFKQGFPAEATSVLLNQAMEKIKSKPFDFIDDGKGGEKLVFRNESGAILNNPENQLNPFTVSELLTKELKSIGILDEGEKQKGVGTYPDRGEKSSQGIVLNISNARTQLEANEIVTKSLISKGLTRGSNEFDNSMQQAWKDNNIYSLPEK